MFPFELFSKKGVKKEKTHLEMVPWYSLLHYMLRSTDFCTEIHQLSEDEAKMDLNQQSGKGLDNHRANKRWNQGCFNLNKQLLDRLLSKFLTSIFLEID